MTETILFFIAELLIPVVISGFTIFIMPVIKRFIDNHHLKQLVTIAVAAAEQYLQTEDGYVKLEAVKDYILARVDIEEEDLIMLIEATIYELNQVKKSL